LAEILLREYPIERLSVISPLLTNVSALPGETWILEMAFSVLCLEKSMLQLAISLIMI